jgi:putative transposase
MAKYNPKIHHRRSIRFKGYDYSKSGLYFITINCQNNANRFGDVVNGEMKLNEFGKIAHEEWIKLEDRFPNFELDVFQIMPNHMHGIISLININPNVESTVELTIESSDEFNDKSIDKSTVESIVEFNDESKDKSTVAAGFTPARSNNNNLNNRTTKIADAEFTSACSNDDDNNLNNRATARVAPTRVAATIGDIIRAYKSIVANKCLDIYKSRNEIMGKFWQRDYYDIIIRNQRSYLQITKYIENNPKNWKKDKFKNKAM